MSVHFPSHFLQPAQQWLPDASGLFARGALSGSLGRQGWLPALAELRTVVLQMRFVA